MVYYCINLPINQCIYIMRYFINYGFICLLSLFQLVLIAQNNTITHTVAKGETLYKVAVKYNVTLDAIKAANQMKDEKLNEGQAIKIPVKGSFATPAAAVSVKLDPVKNLPNEKTDLSRAAKNMPESNNKSIPQAVNDIMANTPPKSTNTSAAKPQTMSTDVANKPATAVAKTAPDSLVQTAANGKKIQPKPIKHRVVEGQTLYSIAKLYNQNITTLQTWNDLPDPSVKVGQDVVVDWIMPKGEALESVANKAAPKSTSVFERKYQSISKDTLGLYRKITQTGIATWFDDTGASYSGSNMYALHRSAPLRSIIQVVNPINKKTVHVMVIERLANSINNENVMISLTKSAARKLGILDEKSIVDCRYYILK